MTFHEDWTEQQDKKQKEFHECDWEESCIMCQNFKEHEKEFNEEHCHICEKPIDECDRG